MQPFQASSRAVGGPFFTIYRRSVPVINFTWHFHADFEINFVQRGRGRRFVGDSIQPFEPGDLALLGPHLPHSWEAAPPEDARSIEFVVLHFRPDFFSPADLASPELRDLAKLLDDARRGVTFAPAAAGAAGEQLLRIETTRGLDRMVLFTELLRLLIAAPDRSVLSEKIFSPAVAAENLGALDKVLAFLDANLAREFSLGDVARHVAMSPATFGRFFRKATGRTLISYTNELRLRRSAQLLLHTNEPVSEIAHRCGFPNVPYFNRQFLKRFARSPSRYRSERPPAAGS